MISSETFAPNGTKKTSRRRIKIDSSLKIAGRPSGVFQEEFSDRGSLVIKVTELWLACHEFESSAAEDPPCRQPLHVKSVEAQTSSCWCVMASNSLLGILVVKVTDSRPACHEFEPGAPEDPPCREAMRVKSVEAQTYFR
ncbi:hypothetical protein TNCV_3256421 [Trichonephila clavipes]|nr:hypothetical protein TNCV_3256421 [Trichonephila clavipes]